MKVFVVTYNTADKPERRIIWNVYDSAKKAQNAVDNIVESYGSFCVDTEISEHVLY